MKKDQLLLFYAAWGLSPPTHSPEEAVVENLHTFRHARTIPPDDLPHIDERGCDVLRDAFGDALSLSIRVGDTAPLLEVRSGSWPTDLSVALQYLRTLDTDVYFELSIDKDVVARRLLPTVGDQCQVLFFLLRDSLTAFLGSPLLTLDAQLFPRDSVPTVIVLSEGAVQYDGQLLRIVSEDLFARAPDLSRRVARSVIERVQRYRQVVIENLSWSGFHLDRVTPLHFMCACAGRDDAELSDLLLRHLLATDVLFTANRSSLTDHGIDAFYSSPDRTATVAIRPDRPLPDRGTTLARLALWSYGGNAASNDRLLILQNVFARELADDDATLNATQLIERLDYLLNEARWHYRVFVNGEIGKHFRDVQSLHDYAADVAKKVSDSVDSLTKSLTDAFLATVGFVVVTLLTLQTKSDLQRHVVTVAGQVYAGVLAAQAIYRLASIWHGAVLLDNETRTRLLDYRRRIGQRVDESWQRLEQRRTQFLWWFWITLFAYFVIVVAILLIAPSLPSLGGGATAATPTVSPTPSTASPSVTPSVSLPTATSIAPTTSPSMIVPITVPSPTP